MAATLLLSFGFATQTSVAQCVITGFEGLDPERNGDYLFRPPSFSGSTTAYVDLSETNYAKVSSELAHSGASSLKAAWKLKPVSLNWLRLTTAGTPVYPNPGISSSQVVSFWMYVGSATPDFYLTAGFRERPSDSFPGCGGNGGAVGPIEWIGATAKRYLGGPIGKLITAKDQWIQVEFAIPCEPVMGFTGNGYLNTVQGVFESLAFTPVVDGADGSFVIYLDDFEFKSTVQCPGDQVVVGSCEGAAVWTPAPKPGDCGAVAVWSSHSPGAVIGFGTTEVQSHILYPNGAFEVCSYKVTVLPPVSVELVTPLTRLDAPHHLFAVGETIPVAARLRDCAGRPVEEGVNVTLQVTGMESDGITVFDYPPLRAVGIGNGATGKLKLVGHRFQLNLNTSGYSPRGLATGRFYVLEVTAKSPSADIVLGTAHALIQSK